MQPMPFLSGPERVLTDTGVFEQDLEGELEALIPLSKVQETLWLDYLRRPTASHYHLTLQVDLGESSHSLEQLLQVIHRLGSQHAMLRSTFHMEPDADDVRQSYMAIHSRHTSIQDVEIVSQSKNLHAALRRDFKLTSEFPMRWIISQDISVQNESLVTKHNLYAVGHHIAIDGFSMSLLSKSILQELESGVQHKLPSASYGSYVQAQNAYLKSQAGRAAKEFWLSQLSNTTTFKWNVPIPTPQTTNYRKMSTWAFFPTEELTSWSKTYKTSWFRIAVSIISLVTAGNSEALPHHDHTLQVAFGARQPEFEDCVSHMANTMPIKAPLASLMQGNATFADTVKQIGKAISTAKKHEMFPLISLLDEARKTMSDSDLQFKVAVTFSPKLASTKCILYPVEGVWDLFFCFLEQDDGVSLGVIVNPQVFDDISTAALQKQFLDTVKLSQETTNFRLLDLSYLKGREVAHIIQGPEMEAIEEISSSRVHRWIKARALSQPDAIALYSAERSQKMTYAEMDCKASQIARYLGKTGTVVLHMDRGFSLLLWTLGTLRAGCCYVVLDKALPPSRKQAILRVAECAHFVTDVPVAKNLFEGQITNIDDVSDEIATQPAIDPPESSRNDDLAYMVFTSGSTGQPKGVMVEHQNLSHYVSAARSVVNIGPGSRVLQFASFAFDASVLEWAVTLSYGGTLCFVDHPALLVGDYLADVIEQNRVNFFHTTPSVLSTIPWDRPLSTLRVISVGGEASSAGLLEKWAQRLQLLHAYGPTETTVIVTVEPISTTEVNPSLIGKPFPNTEIWICGMDETPLPMGEQGEICILGPQVSRGYKDQDELTVTKFRTIEHSGRQVKLYRTGDRGFLNPDGSLSICGRMNNREIKLRGYRIDLAEVEKSILDHSPEVLVASVQIDDNSLVAFVVPATVNCDLVRERLAKDVPQYSIPGHIISLSSLPLNSNGKVDHSKVLEYTTLGAQNISRNAKAQTNGQVKTNGQTKTNGQAQTNGHGQTNGTTKPVDSFNRADSISALEKAVVQLWVEVLDSDQAPSKDTTFFEAGGHSILLTALHKRMVLRFPTAKLRLLDIFQRPTIEKQVDYLFHLLDLEHTASNFLSEPISGIETPNSEFSVDGDNAFAIIGMAGRFPGADNVEQYWKMLMDQGDGISTMADPEKLTLHEEEIFVPRYGTINGLKDFNPEKWKMTKEQARVTDPQKLIFLDVAREALDDAGLDISKDAGVGVFLGSAANTHQYDSSIPNRASSFEDRHHVVLDENISTFTSYKLNLTGPNLTLNTACASSLVALHQGLNALRCGDCECILVGGTNVAYPQHGGYVTTPGNVFATSGTCRPFDASADGSVPSDAVAAVVVKPLGAALRDRDTVYAVIEGYAIGTDGNIDKAGFTVPSSTGQSRTVAEAIRKSGNASQIKYVEMHGSGTLIGDALEVDGLTKAFDTFSLPVDSHVYVGSNKGNCGNSETTSGLLSLIKASLAISHAVVPPLCEIGETNPMCDFENRFRVLKSSLELETGDRIGVSSLGYGGTNAHCVLASPRTYGLKSVV